MTGRKKNQGKQFNHSKKLVQEQEGIEENRYLDQTPTK
jgi:hypothetical protein